MEPLLYWSYEGHTEVEEVDPGTADAHPDVVEALLFLSPCPVQLQGETVYCQQLKRMGARSAGSSMACNDFLLTACLCNMMT
jgi:hypothetical protein